MKNCLLSKLPLTIERIVGLHDYFQIVADNAIINIFKPISLSVPIQSLIHHQIVNISISENEIIVFHFENGAFLHISLSRDDYTCPEACTIAFSDGTCVVMN